MAIFAMLSVLAYSGLKAMVASRAQVEQEAERLGALQMAVNRLGRDLAQAAARPVRDQFGRERPAFLWEPGGEEGLEFTRGGWRNPAARPRSHLQRVAYRFAGGELFRDSQPVLDQAPGQEPYTESLLDKVDGFQARFLDSQGQWRDRWPPAESDPAALPRAAEITLELEDWGRIQRLVPLGG